MKDNYGDKIKVDAEGGNVYLECEELDLPGEPKTLMSLAPAKARKLAKLLKRAAKEAEANA